MMSDVAEMVGMTLDEYEEVVTGAASAAHAAIMQHLTAHLLGMSPDDFADEIEAGLGKKRSIAVGVAAQLAVVTLLTATIRTARKNSHSQSRGSPFGTLKTMLEAVPMITVNEEKDDG